MNADRPEPHPEDGELRPHEYDGIQEFDKRLPNWWLWTLYGAIFFSVGYWVLHHQFRAFGTPGGRVEQEIADNQLKAARAGGALTDEMLWKMSRDSSVVGSGKAIFLANCAACHQPDLSGKIGPNLKDAEWIHGGAPNQIVATITNGVPAKGMQAWLSQLGRSKIGEVSAYILSHHPAPSAPSP
jgi:cytochrome c oxidase cbb3-type subunit 3